MRLSLSAGTVFDKIANAPGGFATQDDIIQPGYTVGSYSGRAGLMVNGRLVRDLLFDHQIDVRYFVCDDNGDPRTDENGRKAHKSLL